MSLRKQSGNMYGFVNITWNVIKGKCQHDCSYCYMKVFKLNPIRFDEKELNTNLGSNNFIFVGSGTDMFAKDVPTGWIKKILNHCNHFQDNRYLFQSKNPERFIEFIKDFPPSTILGTTIESNRDYKISKAPIIKNRVTVMSKITNYDKMITIEPILDFDVDDLILLIRLVKPKWVNIGADSKRHNLPEPSPEKVRQLIKELKKFTKVKLKSNLKRIIGEFN